MTKFHLKCTINGMISIFEIVNVPLLDGDIPCSPSYGVHIMQLVCFAS